jgi:AbiV family abortive infection protein
MSNRKVVYDETKLPTISRKARDNAESYFKAAETLSKAGLYGYAYANLVFCIEESAKSRICMIYDVWKAEKYAAKKVNRKPRAIEIGLDKVNKMFRCHENKHITTLTQTIFALSNTFDKNIKRGVFEAIRGEDPKKMPQIQKMLTVFKNLQKKREIAMYVDADGTGPTDIKKDDYDELYYYAEIAVRDLNAFKSYPYLLPYKDIEKNVKEMLVNMRS